MISLLKHRTTQVAEQIFYVFQHSYQVEADLVGVDNFPPLSRTAKHIEQSDTSFYGFHCKQELVAVIEVSTDDNKLHINSLTVQPKFFRQGIASKMIEHVLTTITFSRATVETAVVNKPAISLYERHGFSEYKQYVPDHGIPKTAMELAATVVLEN